MFVNFREIQELEQVFHVYQTYKTIKGTDFLNYWKNFFSRLGKGSFTDSNILCI